MKRMKHTFLCWFRIRLIWMVLLPLLAIFAVVGIWAMHQGRSWQIEAYERAMAINQSRIGQHLNSIPELVTLLRDSPALRTALRTIQDESGWVEPKDLYYTLDIPISYRQRLSNRAVSAVTIFSNGRLAYYSTQLTTTDQALSRCGGILSNSTSIPDDGCYVVPSAPNGYVYYVRRLTDIYDGRLLGEIVIEVESIPTYRDANSQVGMPFNDQVDLRGYAGIRYWVYDLSGRVIFSDEIREVGQVIGQVLPPELFRDGLVQSGSPHYRLTRHSFYKPYLTAVLVTPAKSLGGSSADHQMLWLLIVAVAAILLVLLYVPVRAAEPLRALEAHCRRSGDAWPAPPAFDPVFREVQTVQEMLGKIAETVSEQQSVIMKHYMKLKEHEFQLLQAQINPHFLFNMLDIIGWQAEKDDNQDISAMIARLGALLHSSMLLNRQERILLGQEVRYIRDYLALEQIRQEGRFTYSIEADDELLSTHRIPKLSIQPVVENCIVHGFRGLERPGQIDIRIWEDVDGIRCTVRDNGVGFHAEGYFERIKVLPPDAKRGHIALYNIQQRIRMLCGPQYGLDIHSVPGQGTTVMILFPFDAEPAG